MKIKLEFLRRNWWRIVLTVCVLSAAAALNVASLSRTNVKESAKESVAVSTTAPHDRRICIHVGLVGDDWPIPEAIAEWNKNGKNIFVLVESWNAKNERCDGFVLLHVEDTGAYWGVTQHTGTPTVRLGVSSRVPLNKRLHVLCHELGHVLGLPHFETAGESCMNLGTGALQLYNPAPTALDLQTVGRDLWDWDKARQSASR